MYPVKFEFVTTITKPCGGLVNHDNMLSICWKFYQIPYRSWEQRFGYVFNEFLNGPIAYLWIGCIEDGD